MPKRSDGSAVGEAQEPRASETPEAARRTAEHGDPRAAEAAEPRAAEALRCPACGSVATNDLDYGRHQYRVHGEGASAARYERHQGQRHQGAA
jgi:uncharacterized C2H2 Zn-finger protein